MLSRCRRPIAPALCQNRFLGQTHARGRNPRLFLVQANQSTLFSASDQAAEVVRTQWKRPCRSILNGEFHDLHCSSPFGGRANGVRRSSSTAGTYAFAGTAVSLVWLYASETMIISYTLPICTALLACPLLGKRLTFGRGLGMAFGLSGVILLVLVQPEVAAGQRC